MLASGSAQDPEPREMWDWEIFQDDWWKTSFRAISWAYKTKPDHPRPPHYHDLLARGRRRRIAGDARRAAGGSPADVSLNSALCGVRAAEEALKRYELEVAILSSDDLPNLEHERSTVPESPCSDGTWNEKVRELLGGILEQGALPEVDSLPQDVPLWDLNNLDSPPSSPGMADLTDSETSGDSDPPPSTPKPTKASYARIVSSDAATSPTVLSPLPSKLLSAAALTFIPSTPNRASSREPTTPPLTSSSNSSDSPFSSPTYNFHFPSLNSSSPADRRESRSLPPSLQKDEAGFYIEVADDSDDAPGTQSLGNTRSTTPRRPSAAFLPAFLTDGSPTSRSRNSKTREIVDRLRSSGSAGSGRKAKKSNKRQAAASSKDSDLTGLVPDATTATKEESSDGWISGVVRQGSSSRLVATNEGWIIQQTQQAPPPAASSAAQHQQQHQQPKSNKHGHGHGHGHGHKRSSGSNASHPPSAPSSTFSPASSTMSLAVPQTPASGPAQLPPMPPLYPGVPTGAAPYPPMGPYPAPYVAANPAAYMHAAQMQYHHPQAVRGPWPMYQPGMYPVYQPFGVVPAPMPYGMVQMPVAPHHGSMFYDGNMKGKPAAGALVQ